MAVRNKTITNPAIGQTITFLQTCRDTDGKLLEMEATYLPGSQRPADHYHPEQQEYFFVLTGELTVRIHGIKKVLRAGDSLHIAPRVPHAMWNASSEVTTVNWKVLPALGTELLLETVSALARDGKTNHTGMPHIQQAALLLNHFSREFRLFSPPDIIQWLLFKLLTPLARLRGLRAVYPYNADKYL